jgi:uncharacterized protein (DUF2267 family)
MIDELRWRGGLADSTAAARTMAAVLEVLGQALSPSEAETVAGALPPPLATALLARRVRRQPSVIELYEHVADRAAASFSQGREQAQVACQLIVDALDEDRGRFLRERLTPEWRQLFEPIDRGTDVELPGPAGAGRTLATGRPGSTHPLSEARPFAGAEDSVVQSENPHAGEKLSSAPGARPGRPIAGSRAGSEVPLSEARDAVRRR